MYELVNTSLPNGLIAGTHGFATVAMTRGMPDILRGRLEALCAYTHRTSVHDATYYQQNPVNWFHVTLPQGDHVVGRVAPSDFDYTGRTNRLARIRVFGASEMPGVGGAEILAKEKHWFSQPWQEEPRYLDVDGNVCARLRMLFPAQTSAAPAWDALLGSGGFRYAQRVAWQLEKNLSASGKTIYFKTSAAWDVSGEKLLALFADVINLLPGELRMRVTFSTYSVSLPGGTGCHLRGVYDRDKFFEAIAGSQTWIDCENAKIEHAELLPTSGPARKIEPTAERQASVAERAPIDRTKAASSPVKLGVRRGPASSGDPNSYRNLIARRKKGPDKFLVGIAVAGAVIVLVAGGCFLWMVQDNDRQMEASGAAAAIESKSLESEKSEQERQDREKLEAEQKAERERAEREREAQAQADSDKRAKEEADKKNRELERAQAQKNAELEAEKMDKEIKAEAERREKQKTAFTSATVAGSGMPPKPELKSGFSSEKNEAQAFRVYYYCDGVTFTNEVAGFKPITQPGNKNKIIDHSPYVREPQCKLAPLERSPVVLWLANGKVWYDWSQHQVQRGPWFKEHASHDLQMECFGVVDEVYEAWNKAFPVTYIVAWGEAKGQSAEWPSREFKLEDAITVVCKAEFERSKIALDEAKKQCSDNEKEIDDKKKEIDENDKKIKDYETKKNQLEKLNADRQEWKNKHKDKNADDKKELRQRNEAIDKLQKEVDGVDIGTLEVTARQCQNKLKDLEGKREKLAKEQDRWQSAYDEALNSPDRKKKVRDCAFSVTVKMPVKGEN